MSKGRLYFSNAGYFDVRAMLTFGVSAKEKEEAIGFFGTGFKYAVAIILRLGGQIKIETKHPNGQVHHIEFTKQKTQIRNQEFEMVQMNGVDAGFTTHLGAKWEPWMAYRELYCNAKDENGHVSNEPSEADTVVTVECWDIYNVWQNRGLYFMESKPLYSDYHLEIHSGSRPFIYYQGIAVQLLDDIAHFSYNFKRGVELSEDRTAKYDSFQKGRIARAIMSCDNLDILRRVVPKSDAYEFGLYYPDHEAVSPEFLQVVEEAMMNGKGVNDSAREVLIKHRRKNAEYPPRTLTSLEEKMKSKALLFLAGIGIRADEYEICDVSGLGENIYGRALKNKIFISELAYQKGTKQVAATLLEEWVHLKNEVGDFDRGMQDWLFDKVLSMGEQMQGEPL